MTPIFLLSLPRSGSTLLQRKLMEHPAIASTDEPWLLLPLLLAVQEGMTAGVHDARVHGAALEDLVDQLPEGQDDWNAAVRGFASEIYGKLAGQNALYFLDKTPRYALVAKDLVRIFPDAKFIFLWRDPLAVVQSMNDTWGGGRWAIHRHEVDLYAGLSGLLSASRILGSNAFHLRYEDLLKDSEAQLSSLYDWLDLEVGDTACGADQRQAHGKARALSGRMGDPKRFNDAGEVRAKSLHWTEMSHNCARRRWMRRYLDWIGAENLAHMGYDLVSLKADIDAVQGNYRGLVSDTLSIYLTPLYALLDYPLRVAKVKTILRGEKIFVFK